MSLSETTYLVFVSDNGFLMGEHMLRDKRAAYEESIRIPLILSGPKIPRGKVIDEIVLNIDIAPTILDLVEVNHTYRTHGKSLKSINNGTSDWRTSFIYEYPKNERYGPKSTILAYRTSGQKLITYPGNEAWNEMYDLVSDPYETVNLIKDPNHASLRFRLRNELFDQWNEINKSSN